MGRVFSGERWAETSDYQFLPVFPSELQSNRHSLHCHLPCALGEFKILPSKKNTLVAVPAGRSCVQGSTSAVIVQAAAPAAKKAGRSLISHLGTPPTSPVHSEEDLCTYFLTNFIVRVCQEDQRTLLISHNFYFSWVLMCWEGSTDFKVVCCQGLLVGVTCSSWGLSHLLFSCRAPFPHGGSFAPAGCSFTSVLSCYLWRL